MDLFYFTVVGFPGVGRSLGRGLRFRSHKAKLCPNITPLSQQPATQTEGLELGELTRRFKDTPSWGRGRGAAENLSAGDRLAWGLLGAEGRQSPSNP